TAASSRARSSSSSSPRASTCRSPTGSCSGRSRGVGRRSSTSRRRLARSRSSSGSSPQAFPSPSSAPATISPRRSDNGRRTLPRTLAVSLGPAAVIAVVWLRLESPAGRPLAAIGVPALSLAVAARRPIAAAVVLLLGAGWPATLHGSGGSLPIGAAILLGTLAILAGLTTRHVPRAVLPAALVLTLAGLAASTSTAVAKGGLVSWQGWDFYTAPQPPVSVAFVWNAQYSGIAFPRKRTTVLEVHAPPRSLSWRAA